MSGRYTHQLSEWPAYRWDSAAISPSLADIHRRRGALAMAMGNLGINLRAQTVLEVMLQDVTKSSAIEGEHLDELQVRSSVARRLGLQYAGLPVPSRDVEGVVEMTLDATRRFDVPLDAERLFAWHASLFPTGRSGMTKIVTGAYRDGPMRIVSGPAGRERVHFEAPAAERLPFEMGRFLSWFEREPLDPVIKAAVSHLWFETVHPFEDGNGRIGRAIMDMALARADGDRDRYYSLTARIHDDRKGYYAALERASRDSMDVTPWITWTLQKLDEALAEAEGVIAVARRKRRFWDRHGDDRLNERQTRVLDLCFDGLHGKLQTSRYARIVKCSTDTALRDLSDLVARGILIRTPGEGRGAGYALSPDYAAE